MDLFLLVDFLGLSDIVIFQQKYRVRYLNKNTESSRKEEMNHRECRE